QGSNIFISGYVEAGPTNQDYQTLWRPLALPDDAPTIIANGGATNIYGIPYIIGARKGFPNFNEISFDTVSQITRKLEIDKVAVGTPRMYWRTNQMFQIGVSNVIGIEAWNPYASPYPRDLDVIMADDLRMSLSVVNSGSTNLVYITNLGTPGNFVIGTNFLIPANAWSGFPNSTIPSVNAASFVTLWSNVFFIPDLAYVRATQQLVGTNASSAFEPIPYFGDPVPHFILSVTNRFRFLMLDPATSRLIDYVQLQRIMVVRDLTAELLINDSLGLWSTNFTGANGVPSGILNQIQYSLGNLPITLSQWNNAQIQPSTSQSKAAAIEGFNYWFYNDPQTSNDLVQTAPFSPTAKFNQSWSWQADDPYVHHFLSDLNDTSPKQGALSAIIPPNNGTLSFLNVILPNLSRVNTRYHPWNFYSNETGDPGLTDPAFKDPLVYNADAWTFPTGQPLSATWLGQVHRGTPWQTVYLKSALVANTSAWRQWTGNTNSPDALRTMPTNDWHLAGLFASLVNTNCLRDMLPVNQIDQASWSTVFSNGVTVLTNVSPIELDSVLMDGNSPQLATVINGINGARQKQPRGLFRDVGNVLAVPELTMNSPWLNPALLNTISDAAYEAIPAQMIGALRLDSIGVTVPSASQPQFQFTGYDGHTYSVGSSPDLVHWTVVGSFTPTNGVFTFTDPLGSGASQRYYRSILVQ